MTLLGSSGSRGITIYTQEELEALTIAQIKGIAEERGYTITATRKAEIIAQFLEQQEAS